MILIDPFSSTLQTCEGRGSAPALWIKREFDQCNQETLYVQLKIIKFSKESTFTDVGIKTMKICYYFDK